MKKMVWSGEIDDSFLYHLKSRLPIPGKKSKDVPHVLDICTTGGDIHIAVAAAEHINSIPRIHVRVSGNCMSGGLLLVASGTKGFRSCTPLTRFMAHRAWQEMSSGRTEILDTELEEFKILESNYFMLLARYTNRTVDEWLTLVDKYDIYFDSTEAIKLGIVDKIT